jgi:hypothetical protein
MVLSSPFVFLTKKGIADKGQQEAAAALQDRLAKPNARLMLHLHGGLIDEKSGKATAARLSGQGPNSFNLGPDWSQVYIVWRTGAFEVLRNDWLRLVQDDRLYQVLLRKLIDYVGKNIGVQTAGGTRSASATFGLTEEEIHRRIVGEADRQDPFADIETGFAPGAPPGTRATLIAPRSSGAMALEFQNELAADRRFQAAAADIDNVVNEGVEGRSTLPAADRVRGKASLERLSGKVLKELRPEPKPAGKTRGLISTGAFLLKHAGFIAYRVFERFRSGRDHGFHATIVEEVCRELYGDLIGAKVWGLMVHHAGDHFGEKGFGTTLLDLLAAAPSPDRLVVTAHSAGAIWASQMLLALAKRHHAARIKLFLLAPAVRQSLFAEAIGKAQGMLDSCEMFTMTDEYERKDPVLGKDYGFIYPSSLLYCVSGMFEEKGIEAYPDAPILGMMRFGQAGFLNAEEQVAATSIQNFFSRPGNGIVTSPTQGVTQALCHGCFDDEPTTLKSLVGRF